MIIAAIALYAATPSFSCSKAISVVEKLICGDEEIALADQAAAALYRSIPKSGGIIARDQRHWLRSRDICKNTFCLLSEYEGRISDLVQKVPSAREYGSGPYGTLRIVTLGKGLYAFDVQNLWVGTAPGQVHTAGASGAFRVHGNRGTRFARADYDTGWRLTKLPKKGWRVECLPDPFQCGGVNALIDGDYR